MIVLDATFRDGGYHTNFEFDLNLVNYYLKTMEKVRIDAIEIGFRSSPKKVIGQFAKVSDKFIEKNLYIPDIEYFGVMINSSDIDNNLVETLFCYCDDSPINLVI